MNVRWIAYLVPRPPASFWVSWPPGGASGVGRLPPHHRGWVGGGAGELTTLAGGRDTRVLKETIFSESIWPSCPNSARAAPSCRAYRAGSAARPPRSPRSWGCTRHLLRDARAREVLPSRLVRPAV